jgi:glucosyl-3-phosphoglycerate synthase
VAQVEFTHDPFEHKHQEVSEDDPSKGLHKMAIDIVTTLFKALIIDEGLEVSDHFFRDLSVTYGSIAEDLIKKYSDNARFNGIEYDRDSEEALVHNVFIKAVLFAGTILESPQYIAENIIRFTSSHEEFKPFIDQGFIKTVNLVEGRLMKDVYTDAELPSWERVQEKDPEIIRTIVDVIEEEKVKHGPLLSPK